MTFAYIWISIILMAIVTYIPRMLPLILLSKYKLPEWFKTWLTFVPTAIFGALVFPDVFLNQGTLDISFNNLSFWSTLFIVPLALKTKSLALTLVSGAAVFGFLSCF